ncbi:MAG: YicC/YloC family endoribonuclease [Methylococcales bacterium]
MLQSMTAFATTIAQENNLNLSWEIRTVNHRYLDTSIRLPTNLRSMETEIRQRISHHVKRGKIECTLTVQKSPQTQQAIQLDFELINQIIDATQKIASLHPSIRPADVFDVISWPGVQQQQNISSETLKSSVLEMLESTLSQLTAMRQREGEQLRYLLKNKCNMVTQQTTVARQRISNVVQETRQRIVERITALQLEPDSDRLEQELIYLTLKMDITEELDRLDTHITEIQKTLQQSEPVGRRLDFLMQELNREANTIGSKSTDIIVSQVSVELKVLIEQMREQVQNIE